MIEVKENLRKTQVYDTELFFDNKTLRLNSNENLFGASPRAIKAISRTKNFNFYPFYGEFLNELGTHHNLEKEYFLPTNGCDEAINVVFSTFLEAGDKVVSFAPTFSMPKIYTEISGANFIELDYEKKWEFDVDKIIEASKEAKIIHITSPNSPTGEIVKVSDVEKILNSYPNCAIVVDNTYLNYSDEKNYLKLIKKYDNLFITKSFSKDYALAGLRLGYVISQPHNIRNLKKTISPYSVNSLALLAGIESLKDTRHFKRVKKEVLKNKKILIRELEKYGFKPYKSEGNFILCDFGARADFIYEKLLKNNILVKKFTDNRLRGCFRISIPPKKGLEKLLDTIKPRTLLIFDLDGVVYDVRNSYRMAIEKTFNKFSGKILEKDEIQNAKNQGGLNCDWDLTKYLLSNHNIDVPLEKVIEVFQEYFMGKEKLIDNEKLILNKKLLAKLSQKYDLCVFTGRPKEETYYSLSKDGILKYFNIIITKNDLGENEQKPSPYGIEAIKEKSLYNKIYYFGDTSDDMKCANEANVVAIGILPPQDKSQELIARLKDFGAKKIVKDINKIEGVI